MAGIEAAGTKHRIIIAFFYHMLFSSTAAVIGLIAYFIRDWRTLMMTLSIPMFTMVVVTWYPLRR